jgi:hypothetical protein
MKSFTTLSIASLLLAASCSASDDASETTESAPGKPLLRGVVQVFTRPATQIGQAHAWLSFTAQAGDYPEVSECGSCWGPVGSGANYVTQVGANGVRCMRKIGCHVGVLQVAGNWTDDGYMAAPLVPGQSYEYKPYAIYDQTQVTYGDLATFGVPKVNTGNADLIDQAHARLGVTVDNGPSGGVTECGVCWGNRACLYSGTWAFCSINFVTQTGPQPENVRCMRQIPCRNAAYFTNDGGMIQRPYELGMTYLYRAYAINDAGVAYGETKSFSAPRARHP